MNRFKVGNIFYIKIFNKFYKGTIKSILDNNHYFVSINKYGIQRLYDKEMMTLSEYRKRSINKLLFTKK